jgi:hypothetical protein
MSGPAAPDPRPEAAGPLVLMLSNAHPPDDVRVVRKEGAALASAGYRVVHLHAGTPGGAGPAVAGVALVGGRAGSGVCWRCRASPGGRRRSARR